MKSHAYFYLYADFVVLGAEGPDAAGPAGGNCYQSWCWCWATWSVAVPAYLSYCTNHARSGKRQQMKIDTENSAMFKVIVERKWHYLNGLV